jgi:hypothetical protein
MGLGRSIFVLVFATYGFGRFVMFYCRAFVGEPVKTAHAKVPFR